MCAKLDAVCACLVSIDTLLFLQKLPAEERKSVTEVSKRLLEKYRNLSSAEKEVSS